jgi:gliding motility-associated-like protein
MNKRQIFKLMAVGAIAATAFGGSAKAQGVFNPCPDIIVNERVDHIPYEVYQDHDWDTVVNKDNHGQVELTAEPYIPVQYFNGTYLVEQIPYNPPDTTFALGTRMPIGTDDVFADSHTTIPYPFYFFGIRKSQFRIGANGLVTFCSPSSFGSGNYCPYGFRSSNNKLPWDGTSGHQNLGSSYGGRMQDAIYGVMEDTHPGQLTGSENKRIDGIYYGIQDQYPCRKIICSWKEAPNFGDYSHKGTYQIVCYEGSNIIEVHVKQRRCCPTTSDALIGIQNATGQPQQRGTPGSPNMYVVNGAPAAFWPNGRNGFTTNIDNEAYRFTPQGTTSKTVKWYRIFDDGRDSIVLPEKSVNMTDTNGYYEDMHDNPAIEGYDPVHPTLTKAMVKPTMPSRYVVQLYFEDAENNAYILRDTIFVGVDTANDLYLKNVDLHDENARVMNVCNGRPAALQLSWGESLTPRDIRWRVDRIIRGRRVLMPASMYEVDELNNTIVVKPDPRFDTLPLNKIDSIRVMASVDFISGSNNYDTFLVRVFPNFDTINTDGICRGETYHWKPKDKYNSYDKAYTENTDPATTFVQLKSNPGCDSVVHLKLTVYDVSLTIDSVESCREYTWRNGHEYSQNNWATMATDTVVLKNQYDCDSVIQLFFTIYPLRAQIDCDVEKFTFDNLDAVLNDVSVGLQASRLWQLPALDANGDSTSFTTQDPTVYFNLPAKLDGATIKLIATSPYGCQDSTKIYIPLEKETMWIPTAFMPDDQSGNNIFSSRSTATKLQEMWIYDRSGRLVAHCEGVDCGWDGRDLRGNPCPQGAYVYVIKYTTIFQPKQTITKHGSVTLIR